MKEVDELMPNGDRAIMEVSLIVMMCLVYWSLKDYAIMGYPCSIFHPKSMIIAYCNDYIVLVEIGVLTLVCVALWVFIWTRFQIKAKAKKTLANIST